jgi:CxxC-x17-CxxC domain-containing protein
MGFTDKVLSCRNCSGQFIFSEAEQEFFNNKGLTNEPKRCPNCRVLARAERQGKSADTTTELPCAGCGQMARVPFRPKGDKPVYCNYCFKSKKHDNQELVAV